MGETTSNDLLLPCVRCGQPAKLQCPKCLELKMPKTISAYCSQGCFKEAWTAHKDMHKPTDNSYMYVADHGRSRTLRMPQHNWTGDLRPHRVGPRRQVPKHIPKPDWATSGVPEEEMASRQQRDSRPRPPADLARLRRACALGREILDAAHRVVKPGVTTDEIDRVVHDATIEAGAYPSQLNYHSFPKSVCTSVNEVVCHGIPDMRELEDGDIINLDISCMLDGFHADLNETVAVGNVDADSKKLMKVAYECLMRAIKASKPGVRYREIGNVISAHAAANGCSVARAYCGHGIGDLFHCAPNIPHYAKNKAVGTMQVGHTFTIEPMINAGTWREHAWPDGWTSVTDDGKRSAQFEHTMVVTDSGVDILTARTAESPPLWWEVEGVALDV